MESSAHQKFSAVTPVPDTLGEYQFAGLLRGARTEIAKCIGSDLQVPATSEMVLEVVNPVMPEVVTQVAAQVGRIDHAHDESRLPGILSAVPRRQKLERQLFIRRAGLERVTPGQVDHFQPGSVRRHHLTRLERHRHPGIIAHLLYRSRQRVEKRCLPRIRIAGKDNRIHSSLIHPG